MRFVAEPIARLIEELNKLPGIGPKSAQRLAYHLLRSPDEEAKTCLLYTSDAADDPTLV